MYNNINTIVSGPIQPKSVYKTVVLKGNLPFASQVSEGDTKYIIKHVFDLGGGTVSIPEGCIFSFEGGTLMNGTVSCSNTILEGTVNLNATGSAVFSGTFKNSTFNELRSDVDDLENALAQPNGIATLDSNGLVPSTQLPSYVDGTVEGYFYDGNFYKDAAHTELITPEDDKIYVDKVTNKSYRWTGSQYINISNPYIPDEESLTVTNDKLKVKDSGIEGKHLNGNVVDDEDIHLTPANKLQFKDRGTTDGMGRIILRKGSSFASQLTQTNTIYEIRYDFDLNNQSITIPANCVLEFDGGSLRNGTIDFNDCTIKADYKVFYSIVPVQDSVLYQEISPRWFGVVDDDLTINDSALTEMNAFVRKLYYYQNTFRRFNSSIPRIVFDYSGIIRIQTPLVFDYPCQVLGFPTFKYVGERTELGGAIVIDNQYSTVFEINIEGNVLDFSENINFGGVLIKRLYYSIFRTRGLSKFYSAIISYNDANSVTTLTKFELGNLNQILFGIYCKIVNNGWPNGWDVSGAITGATSDITLPANLERCAFLYIDTDGSYNPNHWHVHDNYIEGHRGNTPFHVVAGNNTALVAYINNNRTESLGGSVFHTSANVMSITNFQVYFKDNLVDDKNIVPISLGDLSFDYRDLIAYNLGFRGDYPILTQEDFTLKFNDNYLAFPTGFSSITRNQVGWTSDYGDRFGVLINIAPNQIIAFGTNLNANNSLGVEFYTDPEHRTNVDDGVIIKGSFYKKTYTSYPSLYQGDGGTVRSGIIKNTTVNTLLVFISTNHTISSERVPYDITISLWSNTNINFYRQDNNEYGTTIPSMVNNRGTGKRFFKTDLKMPLYRVGDTWVKADSSYYDAKLSGTFSEKPAKGKIYIGYRYFCTDRKIDMDSSSPTYMNIITDADGGLEIIHKGNNVWVDALGRVVS